MNAHNQPISEQYRLTAKAWVEADGAASMLEETKSAVLSQMMARLGDMPVSKAELQVKASPEWHDYVTKMVRAREAANLLKVKLEYIRMKFSEWQSFEATARAERRM
jgi:hypothetical protein